MRKINWKPIGDFVGQVCEVALYGVAIAASCKVGKFITTGLDNPIASYNDAVGAIMDSGMFSHDKSEAVEALNRYESADYYGAIVRIAKDSSMFSHDKVKMIKHLSENWSVKKTPSLRQGLFFLYLKFTENMLSLVKLFRFYSLFGFIVLRFL